MIDLVTAKLLCELHSVAMAEEIGGDYSLLHFGNGNKEVVRSPLQNTIRELRLDQISLVGAQPTAG